MKAFARCYLLAGMWLAATLSSGACQSQGLGEHCDKANGNADCSSDLICGDSFVCCQQGTPQCLATSLPGTGGGAGAAGSAGSTNDASTVDAAAGSANEASTETSVDSGASTIDADAATE
jgi:hypothetical protein